MNKNYVYFSLRSPWLAFFKPQRTQRRFCCKVERFIFFSVFFVATFFETTEGTEVESHKIRSTNIFLFALRGYLFETTEHTEVESGTPTQSNKRIIFFLQYLFVQELMSG